MSQVYAHIVSLSTDTPVARLCRVLGVCRSAFYEWKKGRTHVLGEKKQTVAQRVKEVFDAHKSRYGARRIAAELVALGVQAGRCQVSSRMREQGLKALQPRSFVPKTTQTDPMLQRSPNLLMGMSTVDRPNQVWVGDITYLPLAGGSWAYLATWMDLFSRAIVGHKVSDSMDASIVADSLGKAVGHRCPAPGLIVHSDGGGQYMDKGFRKYLKDNLFKQSMTRVENHYDNAFAESLFSRFKAELLGGRAFEGLAAAKQETFEHIEAYYNRTRRHSSIGYLSPEEFEKRWHQAPTGPGTKLNLPS